MCILQAVYLQRSLVCRRNLLVEMASASLPSGAVTTPMNVRISQMRSAVTVCSLFRILILNYLLWCFLSLNIRVWKFWKCWILCHRFVPHDHMVFSCCICSFSSCSLSGIVWQHMLGCLFFIQSILTMDACDCHSVVIQSEF